MDASSVDFTGGWSRIWEVLGPEVQGLLLLLMAIGVLIAVYATVKFVFDNRRRGGGDVRGLTVLLLIAALLAAPAALIPLLLAIADILIAILLAALSLAGVTT